MSRPLAGVRVPLDLSTAPDRALPRTETLFTPTGDPIEVPLIDAQCPRCLQAWDWPAGLDAELDRKAQEGLVVEPCPACLDAFQEQWFDEHPWDAEDSWR